MSYIKLKFVLPLAQYIAQYSSHHGHIDNFFHLGVLTFTTHYKHLRAVNFVHSQLGVCGGMLPQDFFF